MIKINFALASLFVIGVVLISHIQCDLSKDELRALTRDDNGRADPDALDFGFGKGSFAAWPVLLVVLAVACFVIGILGSLGHVTGLCRNNDHQALSQA